MTRALFMVVTLLAAASARATLSNADDPDMTGKRELGMMQCPSAAPGATTTVWQTRDGVELTVTASTDFGRSEIRRRAAVQKSVSDNRRARGHEEHTGRGTGTGRWGYCPGIAADTTLSIVEVERGVRLVVRSRRAYDVPALWRSTRARVARLQAPPRAAAKR